MVLRLWALAFSVFSFAAFSLVSAEPAVSINAERERLSVAKGEPFWMMFEVKLAPGVRIGWKESIGDWPKTVFQITPPKGMRVATLLWPAPKVERTQLSLQVFYEQSIPLLAQFTWNDTQDLRSDPLNMQAYASLQGYIRRSRAGERVELSQPFLLPFLRLPSEVPIPIDPLVGGDFRVKQQMMPQRIDPGLVDWKIDSKYVLMIFTGEKLVKSPNSAWVAISYSQPCALHDTSTPAIILNSDKQGAKDAFVMERKDYEALVQAGCSEILVFSDQAPQGYIVSLELESIPYRTVFTELRQMYKQLVDQVCKVF